MTKIHQQTFGKGKPSCWCMAGRCTAVFGGFCPTPGAKLSSYCIDLPGHGRSEKIDSFTLHRISDVLVNAVSDENSCWLGWSLGATVVLDIANRFLSESILLCCWREILHLPKHPSGRA